MEADGHRLDVMLCAGTSCVSMKSIKLKAVIEKELVKHGLEKEVKVVLTGCNGFCAVGPVMTVQPEGIFYEKLSEEVIPEIVESHFLKGSPVERLMFTPPDEEKVIPHIGDIGFFANQTLVALRNRGLINPEKIDEYIGRGGYAALGMAATAMTPEEIVNEIKDSGLRGRGGGGFPTGIKWGIAAASPGDEKYLICNADEGDPGAYMDRSIVESDPHAVIEGMAIGAKAIGATKGIVYIRAEYPLARRRLEIAIKQAHEYGLLGDNILHSDLSFDISIKQGAGAFVCGEETSLIASIEGLPPEPKQKPPFPAEEGLWGKPTNINNVETWATIGPIISRGSQWFADMGTEKSKGTKVFSLVGKIRNTGLIEVLMGTPLRKIIYDIGDGIPDGKEFKAVQTGGPSGGCIPASLLDLPVDYERLKEAGAIMGSGGMIVMDETSCMVDVARYFIEFTSDESCGKCSSCRDGSIALLEILNRICEGKGREGDIELLKDLSVAVKDASMCGLGQTLPNPILSTLEHFQDEYESHIKDKNCPAKHCKALIEYSISDEKCVGCTACAKHCPVPCITGEPKKTHIIDKTKCIKCGMCKQVCKFDAVEVG